MRKYLIIIAATAALAGLGLTGCHKSQPRSPGDQMQQGAKQMGQGMKNAANQTGKYMSDAAITSKVKAKLAGDQGLTSFNIHVETNNGVVTLSGTVDNQSQKEMAGQSASNTDGVKSVNNNIKVGSGGG